MENKDRHLCETCKYGKWQPPSYKNGDGEKTKYHCRYIEITGTARDCPVDSCDKYVEKEIVEKKYSAEIINKHNEYLAQLAKAEEKQKKFEEKRKIQRAKWNEYHQKNKEKRNAKSREYYYSHREQLLAQKKEYIAKNKEKKAEQDKRYYEKHKEQRKAHHREYWKKYYQENKEKIAKAKAISNQKNKEKIAERRAIYYQENKEKIAEQHRAYYQKNKETINRQNAQYYQKNKAEALAKQRKQYAKEAEKKRIEKDLKPDYKQTEWQIMDKQSGNIKTVDLDEVMATLGKPKRKAIEYMFKKEEFNGCWIIDE